MTQPNHNDTIGTRDTVKMMRPTPPPHSLSGIDSTTTLADCLYGESTPLRLRMRASQVMRYNIETGYYSTDDDDDESEPLRDAPVPLVKTTSNESLVEELAPVHSHWSQLVVGPHVIDMGRLRKVVAKGGMEEEGDSEEDTPSSSRHRAVTWRVLLGYLPPATSEWKATLLRQRHRYWALARELLDDPSDIVQPDLRGGRRRRVGRGGPSFKGYAARDRKVLPKGLKTFWTEKSLDMSVLERLTKGMNALKVNFTDEELEEGEEEATTRSAQQPSGEQHHDGNEEESPINDDDPAQESSSIPEPSNMDDEGTTEKEDEVCNETPEGHYKPKLTTKEEKLKDFVESAVLLDEIRKDVVRTHPDLAFFLEPAQNLGRRRYAALERILFIWSKYNKGVKYVQGMNEIAGILYYTLANDPNQEWSEWAEADTYWLFHSLLSTDMSDVFIAGLDDHDTGIQGRIHAMQALLARHDPEVREHLEEIGIETSFYAIRWWTTLLSREFLLPDTTRLWDSMFSSTHKDNFLRFVCVTMVTKIRSQLLKSDFSACLQLLHSYPSTNMDELLEASRALHIYESQISLACQRGGLSLHQALNTIASPPALIMAFGFPKGTPPISRVEQLEKARQAVEGNIRGVLGRASRFWSTPTKSKAALAKDTSIALALGSRKESEAIDTEKDIYLSAIVEKNTDNET